MQKHKEQIWDVAVIGGGPSGMMAAGRAAELGSKVILLEKNDTLGKKLLITGGGRCNVTNAEQNIRTFLAQYSKSDKFLFSAFSQFSSKDTLDFFHAHNMPTKIEAENRVFPESNTAQSVWTVMVNYIKKNKVTVLSNSPVSGFIKKENGIEAVSLENGEKIYAKSFVVATGGKSHPETGSTGDGFVWLKKIGHTVVDTNSALVPLAIEDNWVKKLSGVSIPKAKITILRDGKKQKVQEGKMLFTHFGVSGPLILNMSKEIGELLKEGTITLLLDLFPSHDKLDILLQETFTLYSNKKFKNSLGTILPSTIASVVVGLSNIEPDTFCHSITRTQRLALGKLLKNMPMRVERLLGVKKAIITSGGVALEEVNFKTMQSHLFPNLYLIGDILNIDRPSGGFSLQLCWTTGFVAGNSIAQKS